MRFKDRRDAGRRLASALADYDRPDALVLALPRGGVPVGREIARAMRLPLDLMLVRKLVVPGEDDLAMGAIAHSDVIVLNDSVIDAHQVPDRVIETVTARAWRELARRNTLYRGGRPAPDLNGRHVILVDDGVATGADMRAAVESVDQQGAAHIVVAVPVASHSAILLLREVADEVITLSEPQPFLDVSDHYDDFTPVPDQDVREVVEETMLASH
ncbi:phosphoribosyltransferase [Acuticoccus sp. M5D2P5]|uniref:phosphoribosyltransferase n=1 Tax=Acuticoccus kalidii TaxID=2910977 RepID=UPI001F2BF3F7|nr:phosphoribosyltransferase family protein [Acuticoccus kalidii]MCF3935073.1 phosphoribosyltransferase [Acuticoccus kalidii]